MSKVEIAWKVDDGNTSSEARAATATAFVGLEDIVCHLIFNVNMDFTRKAGFVSGGHTTEAPSCAKGQSLACIHNHGFETC